MPVTIKAVQEEEIMINESDDSSEEKVRKPSKGRTKVQGYHRTQSEVVSQPRKKTVARKSVQPAPPQAVFAGNLVDINPFVAQAPSNPEREKTSPTSNSADTPKRRLNRKNKGSAPHQEPHRDTPSRASSQPTTTDIFQVPNNTTPAFNFNPFPQQQPYAVPSTIGPYHPSMGMGTVNPFSAFPAVQQQQQPQLPPQPPFTQPPISQQPTIIQQPGIIQQPTILQPPTIIQPPINTQPPIITQTPIITHPQPSLTNNNINPFLSFQNNGSSVPNNNNFSGFPATIAPQGLFFNVN